MPTEPVAVQPPTHPTHALTTYELARYRRELEHALNTVPEHDAVRELLQAKLTEVLSEQESRIKIRASGRWMRVLRARTNVRSAEGF
jgi:hypothetical protein